MKITLRPVRESDDPFLFEVYASTRSSEMALVPWSDSQKQAFLQMQLTAQKSSYVKEYPNAQHDIICRDDEPVGRLYLDRGPERFHLLDIVVLGQYRNNGIGSVVLSRILRDAHEAGKPTTIYVENFNPSAHLFERLGFRVDAIKEVLMLLKRPPSGDSVSEFV